MSSAVAAAAECAACSAEKLNFLQMGKYACSILRCASRNATRSYKARLESTVRYLGIEVDDALSISEQIEL